MKTRGTWIVGVFALLAFAQTLAYYVYLRDDPGNYNGAGAQGDQVAFIDLAQAHFDMTRVQKLMGIVAPIYSAEGKPIKSGLTPQDVATNQFIDPSIHLPG